MYIYVYIHTHTHTHTHTQIQHTSCRLREIVPPGAWHALQPEALVRAAGEAESGGAQELPAYARSRLHLLTGDNVPRSVSIHVTTSRCLGILALGRHVNLGILQELLACARPRLGC